MIPEKIKQNFTVTSEGNDGDICTLEGTLECCNSHSFEILAEGEIQHGLFSKTFVMPIEDNKLIIQAKCTKCGKVISVFDSRCDGYDQCEAERLLDAPSVVRIPCKKCASNDYSVTIKYEYPSLEELHDLGFKKVDNAYTWIQIKLTCNKCGTKYKKFVDFETA